MACAVVNVASKVAAPTNLVVVPTLKLVLRLVAAPTLNAAVSLVFPDTLNVLFKVVALSVVNVLFNVVSFATLSAPVSIKSTAFIFAISLPGLVVVLKVVIAFALLSKATPA